MSDTESHQASIDASDASFPAENGSREVEHDPPPLWSDEERESDAGVAARTRSQLFCRATYYAPHWGSCAYLELSQIFSLIRNGDLEDGWIYTTLPSARTPKIQGVLFVVDSGESGGVSGSGSRRTR